MDCDAQANVVGNLLPFYVQPCWLHSAVQAHPVCVACLSALLKQTVRMIIDSWCPCCVVCRYEFGTIDSNKVRKVLAVNPALPFLFKGLPEGAVTLYVCAVDSYAARECAQENWKVMPAAADFKVADALTSINVEDLVNAGDVSVMAAGAQALQSLSKFADASAGTQTEAEKQQIQSAIAAKTSSMIGSLAENIIDLVDDPNTMAQVRRKA